MRQTAPHSPTTTLTGLSIAALLAIVGLASALPAQTQTVGGGERTTEPGPASTGRDFAGLLLQMPAQEGGFTITARTAWTWVEDAPAAPPTAPTAAGEKRTLGAPVQRMYLKGDAKLQIGHRRLSAARAVVWVERIDDGTVPEDQALYQVAVYFDRVNNPMGASGAGATGDRLLMTARVRGRLTLAADAPPRSGRPNLKASEDLVTEGEQRLARYLDHLADPEAPLPPPPATLPRPDPNATASKYLPSLNRPYEPGSPYGPNGPKAPITRLRTAPGLDSLSGGSGDQRLFSGRGVITVAAGQPVFKTDGGVNRLIVTGGVVLQYSEPARDRGLQLSAQNAVVFVKPGSIEDLTRAPADAILGIYLEGDVVATDNRFTLRAPYIYYDLVANQAYTVDAVFWTFDERRGLPLYLRADSIRQTSRNSVTAEGVTIAASSFFDPVLSLGASSVTLSRQPDSSGQQRVMVDGKNFTPGIGGLPFFWIPGYNGDIERFPLKDVRFDGSSDSGVGVQTRWDVFGLTGLRPPDDFDLDVDLLIDAWFKRGIALGGDIRWNNPDNTGSLLGYWVPSDNGTDVLSSGEKVDRDGDARAIGLYEQRIDLSDGWQFLAEGTSISDANFVDAYFEEMAETRREFATSGSLRYTGGNAAFTLQAKGSLDDFSPNEYILQSQGHIVQKLPEVHYTRIADDLMPESSPGTLLWTHEYRVGRVQQDFFKATPRELGYPTDAEAQEAFGLNADQSFEDAALAAGLTEDAVFRADTRQQLTWNLSAGPFKFQPYLVGRVTYYDNAFEDIAPDDQEDQLRWWAGGGARVSTQLQRVYDDIQIDSLDIHKVRHIIEPSASFFSAGTNRHNEYLQLYDYDVEGAQEGTAWRIGVNQTFQTLRGRSVTPATAASAQPGDRAASTASGADAGGGRSVDFLRWNIDYVDGTSDTDPSGPIGTWFEYRPEESIFGNYVNTDAQLLLTDSTTLIGGTTYDFDLHQPSRTSVGILIDHGRGGSRRESRGDVRTFAELRFLNPMDTTYVTLGGDFRVSSLYTLGLTAALDTDEGELQDLAVRINRDFPDMTLTLRVRYNNITEETSFGVIFTPLGRNRRLDNMRRIGRDQYLEPLLGTPGETSAAPQ